MSTKSTLAHGETFHLYSEVGDDYSVFLEIDFDELTDFSVTTDAIKLGIPADIWKIISAYPGNDLDWANKSISEINQYVTEVVDGRLKSYKENNDKMVALSGLLVFGDIQDTREEQISRGVDYYIKKREEEIKILNKYNKHKRQF